MKFGITQRFSCSYLPEQDEQLLVYVDSNDNQSEQYAHLLAQGFRRSGDQLYRPHCPSCQACEPLRVLTFDFKPSKSQKRILNKNRDIYARISREDKPHYYSLYERYINTRHQDGSMYPASREQYAQFCQGAWSNTLYLELLIDDKLIAVAIMDEVASALSAFYTFFDPDYEDRSIGTLAILRQIELCRSLNMPHLYLGFQIDDCKKMNYKRNFVPHQRFLGNSWHLFRKK